MDRMLGTSDSSGILGVSTVADLGELISLFNELMFGN